MKVLLPRTMDFQTDFAGSGAQTLFPCDAIDSDSANNVK